jgi:hypothetical protein
MCTYCGLCSGGYNGYASMCVGIFYRTCTHKFAQFTECCNNVYICVYLSSTNVHIHGHAKNVYGIYMYKHTYIFMHIPFKLMARVRMSVCAADCRLHLLELFCLNNVFFMHLLFSPYSVSYGIDVCKK